MTRRRSSTRRRNHRQNQCHWRRVSPHLHSPACSICHQSRRRTSWALKCLRLRATLILLTSFRHRLSARLAPTTLLCRPTPHQHLLPMRPRRQARHSAQQMPPRRGNPLKYPLPMPPSHPHRQLPSSSSHRQFRASQRRPWLPLQTAHGRRPVRRRTIWTCPRHRNTQSGPFLRSTLRTCRRQ